MHKIIRHLWPLLVVALTAAACGSNTEDAEVVASTTSTTPSSTTEEPTTTVTPTTQAPTTTEAASDPDAWIAQVNEARGPFGEAMTELIFGKGDPSRQDWGTLGFEVEFWQLEADANLAYAAAMADPPPKIADAANAWAALHQRHGEGLIDHIALVDASGFTYDTALDDIFEDHEDLLAAPFLEPFESQNLCFEVLVATDEAGYTTILDCTGSSEEPDQAEITIGADGVGVVPEGNHDLAPGQYAFDLLARPFSIELTEPSSAVVGGQEVELFVEEAGYAPFFTFVARDAAIPPGAIGNNGLGVPGGISFENLEPIDDWGVWFNALPFDYETGTTVTPTFEARYWRLLDIVWDGSGELPMYAWAESDINPGQLITPGSVFWEIPHPDGSIIVYANKVVEAPDDVSSEDRLAIGEDLLQRVTLR